MGESYIKQWKGLFNPFYHLKDNPVMYRKIHYWLNHYVGRVISCENKSCEGKCKKFNWSLKPGYPYDFNINNFMHLCNSCNQKMDWTTEKAIKHKLIRIKIGPEVGRKNSINTKRYYSNPKNRKAQSERLKKYYKSIKA